MRIEDFFKLHKNVAVAFSGGVDSSVLLLLAKKYAESVGAYYVKSAFQPEFEYEDAKKTAKLLDVDLNVITVDVLSCEDVASNPADRCYYCKKQIFGAVCERAKQDGFEAVLDGTNASDDLSDRPGFKALKEMDVISPLFDCGITKSEIREIAKENNLPTADKPSYACLATRIPTRTRITMQLLEKTEKAENILSEMGFKNFRVRYSENNAKIELGKNEFDLFFKNRQRIVSLLGNYYDGIYLDLKERADE